MQALKAAGPIDWTVLGISTFWSDEHPENVEGSITDIKKGIFTDFSEVQLKNAAVPIRYTEAGISISVRDVQLLKAEASIVACLLSLTLNNDSHPEKTSCSIVSTDGGISIDLRDLQSPNALDLMHITEYGIFISSNDVQPKKDEWPMIVTDLGILIFLIEVHPEKAAYSIVVTDGGIKTSTNVFLNFQVR